MPLLTVPSETAVPAAQLADPTDGAGGRRARARAALSLADQLLNRLELLSLRDRYDVPAALSMLIEAVERSATDAGIRKVLLDSRYGVMPLMDEVYDLEEELLPRCRLRAYPRIGAPAN